MSIINNIEKINSRILNFNCNRNTQYNNVNNIPNLFV